MARKASQIKNVLIKTKTEGSKQAIDELNDIDKSIGRVNSSTAELIGKSRTIAKAFGNITQATRGLERSSKSIADVGKALNSAFSGNVKQTKAVDSYATNIEFLGSIMQDFNGTAKRTAKYMTSMNSSMEVSPFNKIASSIETLIGQMQELVEGIDDLNQGSRISNARLKQVREYIADVGQSADLTTEQIEDLTRGIGGLNVGMARSEPNINKYNNGLRRMNKEGSSTTRGFSDIVFGSNPLVNAYAAIAVNVYAASEAFRLLNDAANFNRMADQLGTFTAAVSGVNIRGLSADLQEAATGALTFRESLTLATQGTAFQFTADQMKTLTERTRQASIALGRDFTDSMDRALRGIAKQEIEILDEIGVKTKLTTAFNKYAESIGVAADDLSEYQRQVALYTEVVAQLEKRFSGIDAGATAYEKLSVAIRDAVNRGTEFLAEVLEPTVDFLNFINSSNKAGNDYASTVMSMKDAQVAFNAALEAGNFGQSIQASAGMVESTEDIRKEIDRLTASIEERSKQLSNFQTIIGQQMQLQSSLMDEAAKIPIFAHLKYLKTEHASVYGQIQKDKKTLEKLIQLETTAQNAARISTMKLAEAYGIEAGVITSETAQAHISYVDALLEAERSVGALFTENNKLSGSYSTVLNKIKPIIKPSTELSQTLDEQAQAWGRMAKEGGISSSVKSLSEFEELLTRITNTQNGMAAELKIYSNEVSGSYNSNVKVLERELAIKKALLVEIEKTGKATSADSKAELERGIRVLNSNLALAQATKERSEALRDLDTQHEKATMWLEAQDALGSKILEANVSRLETEIAISEKYSQDTTELKTQLAILKEQVRVQKYKESKAKADADLDIQRDANQLLSTQSNQNERTQVGFAQRDLDLRYQKALLIDNEIEQQNELLKIGMEQEALNNRKAAAGARDAQSAFGQLQGLGGLSDLQQGGLQAGEAISKAFADAQEVGKEGFGGFVEYLTENANAFSEMSISLVNASSQMFQSLSDAKIASIDREIEAEQRRDGKSKESLEKIKKLEAQKIKENAKSAKAQVVMSTSVAIMRAFQDFGVWGAIPAAIMAGFGAMQISQINSAANGQLAALNGSGTDGMSITGGSRDNKVDVSNSAQSGEAAYFGGLTNDLPGRAGGGDVDAGDAITVGEVGPEVFIPDVPGSIIPSGRATGDSGIPNMNLTINAVDSKSMLDQIDLIRAELFDRVDEELRARHNTTLENLR